jgi:anti-sigma regulatory factor (Ser/Thr protein kinase)
VDEIPRARQLARRISMDLRLDVERRFQLRIALHEAVANAVVHGCRDAQDRVDVHARAEGEWLIVDVVDPGGTYEPSAGSRDDPFAPGGRGNVLLEATTDGMSIDVRPGRTRLRFWKRLGLGPPADHRPQSPASRSEDPPTPGAQL